MMSLDASKAAVAPRFVFALSRVSTAAFCYSSRYPVEVSLVSEDGEIVSCGFLPPATLDWKKIEFRGFAGLRFEGVAPDPKPKTDPVVADFLMQMDLRHKVGEPVDPVRMTAPVSSERQLTRQEETRRHVMATLRTLGVMPTEEQLDSLEMELGFDFEADEFGDYLEPEEFDERFGGAEGAPEAPSSTDETPPDEEPEGDDVQ